MCVCGGKVVSIYARRVRVKLFARARLRVNSCEYTKTKYCKSAYLCFCLLSSIVCVYVYNIALWCKFDKVITVSNCKV